MVHDNQVGRFRRFARPLEEAVTLPHLRVGPLETVRILGREPVPGAPVVAIEAQFGPVAGVRPGQPEEHRRRQLREVRIAQVARVARRPAAQAQIVRAALQQRGAQRRLVFDHPRGLQHSPKRRDVLREQLLLEVDGVRRNDHAFAVRERVQRRRHEVGQRFPHARACFDHVVPAPPKALAHRLGHLDLLRALLEVVDHRVCRREDASYSPGRDRGPGFFLVEARVGRRATDGGQGALGDRHLPPFVASDRLRHRQVVDGDQAGELQPHRRLDRLRLLSQSDENVRGRSGVGERAMVLLRGHAKVRRQVHQTAPGKVRDQQSRKRRRINGLPREVHRAASQERQVEPDVLADDRAVAREVHQRCGDIAECRRSLDRAVRDPRHLLNEPWNLPAGVHERLERVQHPAVSLEAHRTHFGDAVAIEVEPGRFDVNGDERLAHGATSLWHRRAPTAVGGRCTEGSRPSAECGRAVSNMRAPECTVGRVGARAAPARPSGR